MHPRLSICIATLNRGTFIGETLDTIVPQLRDDTELLVVDVLAHVGVSLFLRCRRPHSQPGEEVGGSYYRGLIRTLGAGRSEVELTWQESNLQ